MRGRIPDHWRPCPTTLPHPCVSYPLLLLLSSPHYLPPGRADPPPSTPTPGPLCLVLSPSLTPNAPLQSELTAPAPPTPLTAPAPLFPLTALCPRRTKWLGIACLACKLSFIVHQIRQDRAGRPVRAIRKEAALVIATWYKRVLLRR